MSEYGCFPCSSSGCSVSAGCCAIPHFSPMNWVLLMGWFWVVMVFVSIILWWQMEDLTYDF